MKICNIKVKAFDFCEMNWYNRCYSYKDYDDALKAYHNIKNDLLAEAKNFCDGGVKWITTDEHTYIVNDSHDEISFKIQLSFDFSKEEHLNLYSDISLPNEVGAFVKDDFKKSLAQHHNGMYGVQLCTIELCETELR